MDIHIVVLDKRVWAVSEERAANAKHVRKRDKMLSAKNSSLKADQVEVKASFFADNILSH